MDSFTTRFDATTRSLDDSLSSLIDSGSDFELEKNGDVLVIIFSDGGKFIISPNSPVSQLWVSANYEGHRFNFDEAENAWLDEKTGEEFLGYLSRSMSDRLSENITIPKP